MSTTERTPGNTLYQGDHWSVSRELPLIAEAEGFRTQLWVISAGYGLVSADTRLASYAATFSPRHLDSIVRDAAARTGAKAWWSLIAQKQHQDKRAPRTLTHLTEQAPRSRMLVVASLEYVRAVEDDLRLAARKLVSPENLLIVSSRGHSVDVELRPNVIAAETRLRSLVGGGAQGLNARTARWILQGARSKSLDASTVQRRLARLLKGVPPVPTYEDRKPMTDEQVLEFVKRELATSANAGWTRLLRKLREGGSKCEQGRFREIYRRATEGSHARNG